MTGAPLGSDRTAVNPRHLTLADILDQRAYERMRPQVRSEMIGLKARRRVHLGTVISLVFENSETVRYQIHEMARAEKHTTDEQIQTELDAYNPLIPAPGHLSATLFIECTTDEQMREWFPKLVGIESALEVRVGSDAEGRPLVAVRSTPDEDHQEQLTRSDITSAVHYVRFEIGSQWHAAFLAGPVVVAVTHPAYLEELELSPEQRAELGADVAPDA